MLDGALERASVRGALHELFGDVLRDQGRVQLGTLDLVQREVNDLPLSMILSWYEQKAVAILLSLLSLGIKDIRLGPSLPAFVSPNILNVLVEKFNIMPIKTPDEDLKAILG